MRKFVFLSTLSFIAVAAPAQAANFSGPRLEVRGGWDRVGLSADYDDGFTTVSGKDHKDGWTIGGEVGYDGHLSKNITLGAYAGIDFPHTRVCGEVFGNDSLCLKSPRNITAGARLGAVVGSSALLYVKGGYSNGRLKVTYTDFADAANNFSDHANRGGLHVGAGGELAIGTRAYVKAEYVYTNYKSFDYDDGSTVAKLDGDRSQLLFGVGIRF